MRALWWLWEQESGPGPQAERLGLLQEGAGSPAATGLGFPPLSPFPLVTVVSPMESRQLPFQCLKAPATNFSED